VFFRSRFWDRLIANIGIVLVFAAYYLRFLRRPMNKERQRPFAATEQARFDETSILSRSIDASWI
jgi:hypothetical protein